MSYSGDAAEQVVRMSLETGEVAVRLAGSGAKQLAILIYAILREQKKDGGQGPPDQYAPQRQGAEGVCRQGQRPSALLPGGKKVRRPLLCIERTGTPRMD